MSFISKVIEHKDSSDLREHSDGIFLLLIKGEHCLEKCELKTSGFCLKSAIYYHGKLAEYQVSFYCLENVSIWINTS